MSEASSRSVSRFESKPRGLSPRKRGVRFVWIAAAVLIALPGLAGCAGKGRVEEPPTDPPVGSSGGSRAKDARGASTPSSSAPTSSVANAEANPTDGSSVLIARAYIRAEAAEVWRHFVEPAALSRWSTAECRAFEAREGGAVRFSNGVRTVYEGEVLRMEEPLGLAYTFRFVGFGFEEPDSHVRVDVLPRGEVVFVSIRHDCSEAPRTSAMIGPVGWTKSLSRLKTLLETGKPMPWPREPVVPGASSEMGR